jgi:hypothetical protein
MIITLVTPNNPSGFIVGVVEGADITIGYKGGAEPIYGTRIPVVSVGSFEVSFSLTRWYFADDSQRDLLLNLMEGELNFTMQGQLYDNSGAAVPNSVIKITGCRILKYRPRMGGADDIIGEEATGVGTNWDISGFIDETTP